MNVREVLKAHGLSTQDDADRLLIRLAVGATVCAWCDKELKPADDPTLPVSHGICKACKARVEREVA